MTSTFERTKEYVAPALTAVGSLERVTLGNKGGNYTDAAFPAQTPRGAITFS